MNDKQFWLHYLFDSGRREIQNGVPPDALPELPAFNDERPFPRPSKGRLERNDKIEAITVVEPSVFVPFVAVVVGEGPLD